MSEGHSVASIATCSARTPASLRKTTRSAPEVNAKTSQVPRFCVNEVPWKLVPQIRQDELEYEFVSDNDTRLSDVESFVWKWSPCGRYGIDMPGGRDVINQQLKDRMAVFDLDTNTWTFYTMNVVPSEIPRVCFLYWVRIDVIAIVSLVKDHEAGPDDEMVLQFKQSFYYVSHEDKVLIHAGHCKYCTSKTIAASYWYHIFENRRGEPFVDHNRDVWLVFSNGKDSLILLPFLPTATCWKAKCVKFDMNQIMSTFIDKRVFLDPFISSHFVPWVYRNDINFFIRIDAYSFFEDRDYGQDEEIADASTTEKYGMYQIRINLKDVIERGEKAAGPVEDTSLIETRFDRMDVEFYRKISEDSWHAHECITQHGKTIVLHRWEPYSIHVSLSKKFNTRICDSISRKLDCCTRGKRDFSFCTIDLDNGQIRPFDSLILGTDVIVPHPNGSMLMFRYKEDYGMRFCELPYFKPATLRMQCLQALAGCVEIDPAYYDNTCCLRKREKKIVDEPRPASTESVELPDICE